MEDTLLAHLLEKNNNTSFIFSPLGIKHCLHLLLQGSNSKAHDQLKQLLGDEPLEMESNSTVSMANSVWCTQEVNEDYKNKISKLAQTFKIDPTTLSQDMNSWINKTTKGLIKELNITLPSPMLMLTLNVMHFDAEWKKRFDRTTKDTFYCADNTTKKLDFMEFWMQQRFPYYHDDTTNTSLVCLDYSNKKYTMAICYNEDKLYTLPKKELFKNLSKTRQQTLIKLSMPKFEVYTTNDLLSILVSMGLDAITDTNFKQIHELAYVSSINQSSKIMVNELGTKVVSAISATHAPKCKGEKCIRITLDHPFSYYIIDKDKKEILFTGVFMG
jgi:serine protease inhibitor